LPSDECSSILFNGSRGNISEGDWGEEKWVSGFPKRELRACLVCGNFVGGGLGEERWGKLPWNVKGKATIREKVSSSKRVHKGREKKKHREEPTEAS